MADFSDVHITVNLNDKTASVTFRPKNFAPGPVISVSGVLWDTPDDQTESQIKALVIENARQLLREA